MSFRDFLAYYGELELCHLTPGDVGADCKDEDKKFDVFHFDGEWTYRNSGGCGNDGTGKKKSMHHLIMLICALFC